MTDDIRKLPGLKARQIGRTVTGKGVAEGGPIFYRVTIEQCVLDTRAIGRQTGLEQMIGNAAIAAVMGPDEDIAKIVQSRTVFLTGTEALELPVIVCLTEVGDG